MGLPRGDAGLKYTPIGGSLTTFALAAPLRNVEAVTARRRVSNWSLDLTSRETIIFGSAAVRGFKADIRFADPVDLLAWLEAALDGVASEYVPSLASPGTSYPALELVEPDGDVETIARDRARWIKGEYELRVHFRRTDGGNVNALLEP